MMWTNCSLIGPVELTKKYAEAVCAKTDNFGLMVDLSHLPLLRETAQESLEPVKDYIIHAHMGNAVTKEGLSRVRRTLTRGSVSPAAQTMWMSSWTISGCLWI